MESEIITFILSQKGLSMIGLFLDMSGALLIWKYGIPSITDREGKDVLELNSGNTQDREKKHRMKVRRYDRRSRFGVGALAVGFFLQLISNCVQ